MTAAGFHWKGTVPFAALATELEVRINLAQRLEVPDLLPSGPMPEVGPVWTLEFGEDPVYVYRFQRAPRGLDAFASDPLYRATLCVYLERGGHRYLFLLRGDPGLRDQALVRFRAGFRELNAAYEAGRLGELAEGPLGEAVRGFLKGRKPLARERRLVLAEAVAEVAGKLRPLLVDGGRTPDGVPTARAALPAGPGKVLGLALRFEVEARDVYPTRMVDRSAAAGKGIAVRLRLPGAGRPRELAVRTDADGWVELPELAIESPRALTGRAVKRGKPPLELQLSLPLRWGRPLEPSLDSPTPTLAPPREAARPADLIATILRDLAASWDPDTGELREPSPGGRLVPGAELALALSRLGPGLPFVDDLADEAARRARAARPGEAGFDPVEAWLLGDLDPAAMEAALEAQLEANEAEGPGIWTEDQARGLERFARALALRPAPALAGSVTRMAEALAARIDSEPEPTWRYRAFQRPIKTFRANADVAHPHADAILALARASAIVAEPGTRSWLWRVADGQARHLLERHPLDGEPPAWLQGSWKERAHLETPLRIGYATEVLGRMIGSTSLLDHALRIFRLARQRFLAAHATAPLSIRLLFLAWLAETGDRGSLNPPPEPG